MSRFKYIVEAFENANNQAPLSDYYEVDLDALPKSLAFTFVQLSEDESTTQFLRHAESRSIFQIIWARILMLFLTFSDAIAYAGINSMHVLSTAQARTLLAAARQRLVWRRKAEAGTLRVEDVHGDGGGGDGAAATTTMTTSAGKFGHLLDVGAGEGRVTAQLAPLFESVTATEVTPKLVSSLQSKGFRAVLTTDPTPEVIPAAPGGKGGEDVVVPAAATAEDEGEEAHNGTGGGARRRKGGPGRKKASKAKLSGETSQSSTTAAATAGSKKNGAGGGGGGGGSSPSSTAAGFRGYDTVSLLNVLDRCNRPLQILSRLRELVRDDGHGDGDGDDNGGLILMAVVLPFRASVESKKGWIDPEERLPKLERVSKFESSMRLLADTLAEQGLEVVVWSRIPYLSMSLNWLEDYAVLSDAVLVCRRVAAPPGAAATAKGRGARR